MGNMIFSMNFIVGSGIALIMVLLVVLFFFPYEEKNKKKKKKLQAEEMALKRDWKMTAHRLEELVRSLKKEIEKHQEKEKISDKQIAIEQARVNKLKEKLDQEHTWNNKEQKDVDKKAKELQTLKSELLKLQDIYTDEHSSNIKLQHELSSLKKERDDINAERRSLETDNISMKAKIDEYRQDVSKLKKENVELAKKKEDSAWVAKADYILLENKFKVMEKEMERVRRQAD